MERIDKEQRFPSNGKRLIVGILFLLFGFMVLSKYFGWLTPGVYHLLFSWEIILIAIGVLGLLFGRHTSLNLILIIIGTFFLLAHRFDFPFEFKRLIIPFILIFIGLMILFQRRRPHYRNGWPHHRHWNWREKTSDSSDFIDDTSIFGGGKINFLSENFKGGRLTSIFGGSEINLSKCKLAEGKNIIDVFMIFGGSNLIVPSDWYIKIDVVSIFGGFSDKRHDFTDESKKENKELHIKGLLMFGGGEIKNF
ncbi:MAG: hypothetical protein JXB17_11615 [Bacteroidales bacterium]|nr:hypothetical protein [Bacteroidales bacterium]